jgi:electron transfer flavoprotein alpha subunit
MRLSTKGRYAVMAMADHGNFLIAPDVYIACGISGAIQHWAGCQSAKTILAINTDADAPMVTRADYAVVGDLHQIVPAVVAELRRRRG